MLLRYARVPIPNDPVELKNASAIEEIDARVTFKQPGPEYPSAFGNVVAAIRPAGAFEVGGGSYFRFKSSEKPDWFFGVSTDAGAFTLTDKNVKITGITADATVSSDMVDIKRFDGSVLGGRIVASGKVTPKEPYVVESGTLSLSEIDLAQLARTVQPKKPNDKLVGRGTLNTTFAGGFESGALNGAGEFEIIEGHFWSLPVIGEIASKSAKGRGLTRGEAAGVFRLEGRKVMLENAAVSSSALGLIGSGAIDVDNQSLEFRVIAAPLGDWRDPHPANQNPDPQQHRRRNRRRRPAPRQFRHQHAPLPISRHRHDRATQNRNRPRPRPHRPRRPPLRKNAGRKPQSPHAPRVDKTRQNTQK